MYEKFAELLVKNDKTAYAVAKETGIAQSVLSDWKNGRSKPKADKLKKIDPVIEVLKDNRMAQTVSQSKNRHPLRNISPIGREQEP